MAEKLKGAMPTKAIPRRVMQLAEVWCEMWGVCQRLRAEKSGLYVELFNETGPTGCRAIDDPSTSLFKVTQVELALGRRRSMRRVLAIHLWVKGQALDDFFCPVVEAVARTYEMRPKEVESFLSHRRDGILRDVGAGILERALPEDPRRAELEAARAALPEPVREVMEAQERQRMAALEAARGKPWEFVELVVGEVPELAPYEVATPGEAASQALEERWANVGYRKERKHA